MDVNTNPGTQTWRAHVTTVAESFVTAPFEADLSSSDKVFTPAGVIDVNGDLVIATGEHVTLFSEEPKGAVQIQPHGFVSLRLEPVQDSDVPAEI